MLYDVLARVRLGVEMIERSVDDLPEVLAACSVICEESCSPATSDTCGHGRTVGGSASPNQRPLPISSSSCWWAAGRRHHDPHAAGSPTPRLAGPHAPCLLAR